ncbi:NUDIX hydrolase [Aliinostoc sp. HNIBRCY26]|uniref:NUDIX hydrolase n=1 Tax=Aliinostoc sp. HNIBRCY26 TaxID=3418997 RepID=UPI003D00AE46
MSRKVSKIFKQSGVIPYRIRNGRVEILLISTSDRQSWGMPKGGIVNGMTPPASAAKEAWEEAGVIGQVESNKLGTYKYRKRGKVYRVKMYLLPVEIVSSNYPEAKKRYRRWLDAKQAMKIMKKAALKRILKGIIQTKKRACVS